MIDVTTVTKNASQDALTDADYIAIIDSLRGPLYKWSWQDIADNTGYNSKSWWRYVSIGERSLDDTARNALRRVTDGELPEQPPSVLDVTQRMVDANAEMLLVGTLEPGERVRRVLLMAANDVTVHVNGDVHAEPLETPTTGAGVAECHNDTLHAVTGAVRSVGANREPCYRPKFSVEDRERFEALGGLRKIINAGMKALQENGR